MKLFVVENFSKMNGSAKQSSYNTSVLHNLPAHTCKKHGSKSHFLLVGNALYTINTPQSTLIEKNPTSFKGEQDNFKTLHKYITLLAMRYSVGENPFCILEKETSTVNKIVVLMAPQPTLILELTDKSFPRI